MTDHIDIFAAAARHDFDAVLDFVRNGVHPDTPVAGFGSLLIYAATQGQKEFAGRLITLGAKIDLADDDGNTALHHAAYLGADGMVEYLLQRGADATVANNAGDNAFRQAKRGALDLQAQFNGNETMSVDDMENAFARFGRVAVMLEEARCFSYYRKGIPEDLAIKTKFRLKSPGT